MLKFMLLVVLLLAFASTICMAFMSVDKAVRRNDPTYYPGAGLFIACALGIGIWLGNLV